MEKQTTVRLLSSSELIEKARARFKQLEHKGYEWKSFYSGFLEAYGELICGINKQQE